MKSSIFPLFGKAFKEFLDYKLENISNSNNEYKFKVTKLEQLKETQKVRFSLPEQYIVKFEQNHVSCTCPSYKTMAVGASDKGEKPIEKSVNMSDY